MKGSVRRQPTKMKTCLFILCLVVVCSCLSSVSCVYGEELEEQEAAFSAIVDAEGEVAEAHLAVASAEHAGGNVSLLRIKLGDAGGLLAEANVAFRVGNYENATILAEECTNLVDGIFETASSLKLEADSEKLSRLFLTASYSSVGLGLLFVAGLFGWRFLKRRYVKRVLRMKPEVTDS